MTVDLPAPVGPTSTTLSPGTILNPARCRTGAGRPGSSTLTERSSTGALEGSGTGALEGPGTGGLAPGDVLALVPITANARAAAARPSVLS